MSDTTTTAGYGSLTASNVVPGPKNQTPGFAVHPGASQYHDLVYRDNSAQREATGMSDERENRPEEPIGIDDLVNPECLRTANDLRVLEYVARILEDPKRLAAARALAQQTATGVMRVCDLLEGGECT
jgi:hypothetical protein